jgi:TDG/mug DNA glycosylase family protein
MSAEFGYYYAQPNNKFWKVLVEVGLIPQEFSPKEFWRLPEYGIGLTDLVKNMRFK